MLAVTGSLAKDPQPQIYSSNIQIPSIVQLASFGLEVHTGLAKTGVVGVLRDGRLLLDCRTLGDSEADEVAAAVANARA